MHRRPAAAALAALLTTSACGPDAVSPSPSPPAAPAPAPASYACESGTIVVVDYPDASTARLNYQGATQVLNSQPAASGARYIGRTLEWWTAVRGGRETGVLRRVADNAETEGQVVERCSRPAPDVAAPTPVAPQMAAAQTVGPACRGDHLRLSREGGDAGMGNRVVIVGVKNVGPKPCTMLGYADIEPLDGKGQVLNAVQIEKTPGGYMTESEAPAAVTLATQAKAYFDVAWNVVPPERAGRQTTCPTVTSLRLTPPGDTTTQTLAETFEPCGGRVRVSPLRAEAGPSV